MRWAGRAVWCIGAWVVLLAIASTARSAASACLGDLTGTGRPPSVAITSVSTTNTTATIAGTVDPNGDATTYVAEAYLEPGNYYGPPYPGDGQSPTQSISQCDGSVSVQATITGLGSGERYQFTLFAINGAGRGSASSIVALPALPPPAAQVRLHAHRSTVMIGQTVKLTASASGGFGYYGYVDFLDSPSERGPFVSAFQGTEPLSARGVASYTDSPGRNTWYRAQLGTFLSRPVLVYVYPKTTLQVSRLGAYVRVDWTAAIHYLCCKRARYPSQRLFVYKQDNRKGPLIRAAVQPIEGFERYSTELMATAEFYDVNAVNVVVCWRRRLLFDMGKPFFFAACGRRRLPA